MKEQNYSYYDVSIKDKVISLDDFQRAFSQYGQITRDGNKFILDTDELNNFFTSKNIECMVEIDKCNLKFSYDVKINPVWTTIAVIVVVGISIPFFKINIALTLLNLFLGTELAWISPRKRAYEQCEKEIKQINDFICLAIKDI